MSSSNFFLAIGIILALMLVPVVVMILVRFLIKDEEPIEETVTVEPTMQFDSLKDFWQSNVPHLLELRDRLIKALVGVGIGTILGSYIVFGRPFGKSLLTILRDQFAPGVTLQGIAVAELFVSQMGVALVIGIAIAMPIIVYQIVAFFVPALYAAEKRMVFTALPFVFELFLAGLVFGWFFTVPAAIGWLTTVGAAEGVVIQPSVADFLKTFSMLMLWNGIIFELPAIIFLLARLGVVNTQMLSSTRRYAIVIIVIVAAVITPTGDPFNLLLLAVPMYLLYEMGIVLSRFVPRSPAPTAPAAAD
jgi:sec-independent protein translocase protein TatC